MKNVITSYKKLPIEVKKAIRDEFPLGVEFELKSIKNMITGKYFEGLIYTFKNTVYLIKMTVNTITIPLDDDDEYPVNEDSFNEEY